MSVFFRAYKLGKGKCSYNMVQVDFLKGLKTDEALSVVEANEMSQKHLHQGKTPHSVPLLFSLQGS